METTDVRRLVRRRHDRIIAGVCGGIADHFGIDPTIVRIGAIALTIFGGAGVLLYAVAWVMIPLEGHTHGHADAWLRHRSWQTALGVVLIIIALSSVTNHIRPLGDIGFPIFLLALGGFLLWYRPPSAGHFTAPPTPSPPGALTNEPLPAPESGPTASFVAPEAPVQEATQESTQEPPGTTAREWHREWHKQQRAAESEWRRERRSEWRERRADMRAEMYERRRDWRARRRARRSITIPTLGLLAIGAGTTGIVSSAGVNVDVPRVLAAGLVLVGAALAISTVLGRAGGLIPVGVLLLVALTLVTALSIPFEGGIGRRTYRPAGTTQVASEYHLAIGELVVGLGSVHPNAGSTQTVRATVGIGHLVIEVPRDVQVQVHGHISLGSLVASGVDDGGWKIDRRTVVHPGSSDWGVIDLDTSVGIGQLEVRDA